MKISAEEINRYLRQMTLNNFGLEGQKKLTTAHFVIVGCGGLGAPVIQYLAAAGIGKLTLCDDDRIEITNLNRQILFSSEDIGRFKAEQAASLVSKLNPNVTVSVINDRIGCHNIRQLIAECDCVIDCTDGLPNKFLLNDAAVLEQRALIHGSAIGYQGRLMVITPKTACLRCFFPEPPEVNSMETCSTLGILGPVCGVIGSMMATEAIKLVTQDNYYQDHYLLINFESSIQIKQFHVVKNKNCEVCSSKSGIKQLIPSNYHFVCSTDTEEVI